MKSTFSEKNESAILDGFHHFVVFADLLDLKARKLIYF